MIIKKDIGGLDFSAYANLAYYKNYRSLAPLLPTNSGCAHS